MNKVITINLGGTSYTIEEKGYEKLSAYLDQARSILLNNPDKDEIIQDIEQAIGEKCSASLSAHKNVVTEKDVDVILAAMGPVASPQADSAHSKNTSGSTTSNTRQLYRIQEGAIIAGVCRGIATYFNIDVTLVRIISVVLTIVTGGGAIIGYILMVILVPSLENATSSDIHHTRPPMTAQDILNHTKEGYANFKNSAEWKKWKYDMRQQQYQWKEKVRHEKRRDKYTYRYSPFWELVHSVLGMIWLVFIGYALWLGYQHVPVIHQLLSIVGFELQRFTNWLSLKVGH